MTPTRHRRSAAIAALLALAALPARAEPVAATYLVQAAGITVMELNATLDITDAAYSVEFRSRLRGVASAFGGGELVTRVEGTWQGDAARPRRYVSEGSFRGEAGGQQAGGQERSGGRGHAGPSRCCALDRGAAPL